ncbi:MAG TPA: SulP family inorganic anion transporter, partial [Polyangiales bacterium]|nr:SulP family inorganic anion transporter [Polyangiales bacterium]
MNRARNSLPPSSLPPLPGVRGAVLRMLPALDALRGYSLRDARADVLAGLTVAAVAVPQAMAYAMIAHLPVEVGLYTAIVVTAAGALFSPSRQLINGPTNAISIAVLSALGPLEGIEQRAQAAVLLALMVGVIQLAISALRFGDLSRYISHSVIVGFTAGAGFLLVLDQTKNLLGLRAVGSAEDHFLYRFWRTMSEGGSVHAATAAVGFAAIALVLALRWLKGRLGIQLLPELLLVVIAAAWVVAALGLDGQGVKVVGEIPATLPSFALPTFTFAQVRDLGSGAFAVAVLGLLEAVSMAKGIASQTRQRFDVNQLCVSEGAANLTGAFFHCYPGSGSLTRSAINHQAGGATQWSAVVSALAVAATVLLFAPYARYVPRAALAGILIVSSYKMVDWPAFFYHLRATRFDLAIVLVTAVSAIAISVEFCVLVGVLMSFLLAVPRVGRVLLTEFVLTPEGGIHERLPDDDGCPQILIFGLEGEMFFSAAPSLERHLEAIERRAGSEARVIVLRMKRARNPDAVGL